MNAASSGQSTTQQAGLLPMGGGSGRANGTRWWASIKRTRGSKGQLIQVSKGTACYGDYAAVAPQHQLQETNTTNPSGCGPRRRSHALAGGQS